MDACKGEKIYSETLTDTGKKSVAMSSVEEEDSFWMPCLLQDQVNPVKHLYATPANFLDTQ